MITAPHDTDLDGRIRRAAMEWLDKVVTDEKQVVHREELRNFVFEGEPFPLVDRQLGIRKPGRLPAALSILTTYTSDNERPPYEDAIGSDGLLRYKYQGHDPQLYTNVGLREAFHRGVPLIWFFGVGQSRYLPIYPVWIVADEPEKLQVAVALSADQRKTSTSVSTPIERRYATQTSKRRLHQPVFRERVLQAYGNSCAICHLRHSSLLDAAHIIPDHEEQGIPAVSNGLTLCKIHHAAYDHNLLGIRPNLTVHIRSDILLVVDGPMLKHGLQEMHDAHLSVPRRKVDRPNPEAIAKRYARFMTSQLGQVE
ncbi:HNH endonuclease [Actinomadura hibisca]|uniref:HNH endonuclease n=1 Tax=Actinomadura hibisca TaxID=68565 RepID=UPI001C3F2551|nr:HNH endonuclease [Actinomadura hibisca]